MKIHTVRPVRGSARRAWDYFTKLRNRFPLRMWYAWLDYWVWIAQWDDDETDEIAAAEVKPDWKGYQ